MNNGTLRHKDDFQNNWDFQSRFYKDVMDILQHNAMHFIKIKEADREADMKRATDMIIEVKGGDIAVRIRRPSIKRRTFNDITIRAYKNGFKTEIHKIREGFAKWYLYCWTTKENMIDDYLLIDLDKVRESTLLNDDKITMNNDGMSGFLSISIIDLYKNNCLVSSRKFMETRKE